MDLSGKTAIVTGSARGIGKSIALKLAEVGADIVINDIPAAADVMEETAGEIRALGRRALTVTADVSSSEDVNRMVDTVVKEWGRIDILVNNAGITRDDLLMRMEAEAWDAVINVNLKGTFLMTREAAKVMIRARRGRIVNIASVSGLVGNPGQANYSASKAGVCGLTKTSARELAKRNITANAVAPGFIETDMTAVLPQSVKDAAMTAIPLRRMGQAGDVAEAVAFFASDEAEYITGQTLAVDGGMVM